MKWAMHSGFSGKSVHGDSLGHAADRVEQLLCSDGFALMHNHPSGDASPSRADELVTRRMVEASALIPGRGLCGEQARSGGAIDAL